MRKMKECDALRVCFWLVYCEVASVMCLYVKVYVSVLYYCVTPLSSSAPFVVQPITQA